MDLSSSRQKWKPRCEIDSPGMMDMQMQQQQRNWTDLPPLIISAIMEKLTWEEDYVRFGATCVPWRTVFLLDLPGNAKKHSSHPFLLIPPFVVSSQNYQKPKSRARNTSFAIVAHNKRKRNFEDDNNEICSLYSISRNKVCDFQVRLPHASYCVGSSLGWLVTIKPKIYGARQVKYYVQLQNPFLPNADRIHLPQLPFHNTHLPQDPFMYIHKAALSAPPDNNLNKNFILMAIMSEDYRLAFFNPATKQFCWTPVGDWDEDDDEKHGMVFSDVIYSNRAHQFFAVLLNSGAVYAIDIEHSIVPKLTLVAPPTDRSDCLTNRYIVELPSGDLLQLIKVQDLLSHTNTNFVWSKTIEVLKFDSDISAWVQIHDIGDAMLFIGGISSIARSASDFPNCKPNSIYFTEESEPYFHLGIDYPPDDIGIFNLEDESFHSHYSMGSNKSLTAPIWLEPTLNK